MRSVTCAIVLAVQAAPSCAQSAIPEDFPRFVVPGHEREMELMRRLFWLHYEPAGPLAPLWDEWMPNATLWPARGEGVEIGAMRQRWARALAGRGIDSEGYVHTQQHDGLAHARGWPFPLWTQAGGMGWQFRGTGVAGYEAPLVSPEGWKVDGATDRKVDDRGWVVDLAKPQAMIDTPACSFDSRIAPFLRLNWWSTGLEGADCFVEWTTAEAPEFSKERRAYFDARADGEPRTLLPQGPADSRAAEAPPAEVRTMIPVHRVPTWKGVITGLRIGFDNDGPGQVTIKSFHTACDTRHNVNNLNIIRGCHDYFMWTRDLAFLRGQMARVRGAMRFVEREFRIRDKKCMYTTWPGHEGRSGVRWAGGAKQIIQGEGVGGNYWDLLPFGGEDALATVYLYDTLLDLAELEELIADHPEWCIATGADAYDPADLRRLAAEVKEYGGKRFWNQETGRFGTVDLEGVMHDYGFTFLNNEAVHFDFATPEQARSIHAWLSGKRTVEGDTSSGADIYHWQFGPRSTTRRNVDYYFWAWSNPEGIPWGYQVQDGGAVLGWSYYDLMARLKTAGPDDAAARLAEIAKWFGETQAEGGYRAYYGKDPARGSMQGGGAPGGLGLDKEFFESVLVPQVMLYGFLGFQPTADGFFIEPRLPSTWPELTVTRIYLHGHVLDVTATQDSGVRVRDEAVGGGVDEIVMTTGAGATLIEADGVNVRPSRATGLNGD
jgi:hypothetical protein